MASQGVSSDKAEEHFDGSSGINLIVLCKVLGDKHADCSVGSYLVLLDQDPLTHGQGRYSTRELCCVGAHALQSPWDFLVASCLGSLFPSRNTAETMELHGYTCSILCLISHIWQASPPVPWYVSVFFHTRLSAYSGREPWGQKELHESSFYLSRRHSCGCRRCKEWETSCAIQAFCHAWKPHCVLKLFQWGRQSPWSGLFGLYFGQIITVILLPTHVFSLLV